MSKCFADKGEHCLALNTKKCDGCKFKKGREIAVQEIESGCTFGLSPSLKKIRDFFLLDELPDLAEN